MKDINNIKDSQEEGWMMWMAQYTWRDVVL